MWAFVVMPEHAHVLILPRNETYDTANILKAIKQPVARHATDHLRANAPAWLERLKITRPGGRAEYRFWLQAAGTTGTSRTRERRWRSCGTSTRIRRCAPDGV